MPISQAADFPVARTLAVVAASIAAIAVVFFVLGHLMPLAPEPIGSHADLFVEGARATLQLTIVAGLVGLLIGIVAGVAKLQSNLVISGLANAYIWIIRGTPLLVQILFVYYALPVIVPALKLNEFYAAVVALAFNVGAYNAEAVRAGVLAIPRGQIEAAQSLGLSRFMTMRFVVLPQALRIVTPPLVNNVTALLKDSALASSIGLVELTLIGNRVSSETFLPVPSLTAVAFVYLVLTSTLTLIVFLSERLLGYERRSK